MTLLPDGQGIELGAGQGLRFSLCPWITSTFCSTRSVLIMGLEN